MPTTCAAFGCTNNSKKDSQVTFHRFPSNPKRRAEWLKHINRESFFPGIHTFLCSKHFEESCFDRTGQTVRLRVNAVPTIFIYPDHMLEKISLLKKANLTKPEEELPSTCNTETQKQTDLCPDHTYCLPSPAEIKRKICELERKLEIAHKKIKIYQQRERRVKTKCSGENVNSSVMNEAVGEKASWEVF
ncbi:THAP domain-containing protein 2 [Discoglossus pictus]